MTERVRFTTPPGRMIFGSCYEPNTTDFQGNPLTFKTGDKAGQPKTEYVIGIAIPKGTEQHWAETEWGALIWAKGHGDFPGGQAGSPTFKWKITDGDSPAMDQKGVVINTKVGHAGNWVLAFKNMEAPGLYMLEGNNPVQCVEPGFIKTGYYIQVAGEVQGNGVIGENAGVYLNPRMVCFIAYGEVIVSGPSVAEAGFGGAPLPPGASATPVGGFVPPSQGAPVAPTAPPAPVAPSVPSAPAAPVAPSVAAVPGPPTGNYQPQ